MQYGEFNTNQAIGVRLCRNVSLDEKYYVKVHALTAEDIDILKKYNINKVFGVVFLGMPRSEKSANVTSDCGLSMTIPMGILAVLALLIGVYPQFVFFDIKHIVYCVFPMDLVNLM